MSSRLQNLKNPLQITSSRVKQLVQKLASTLANRYENWCVTNFAGTTRKKLDPLLAAAKIRKAYTSNGTILPCLDKSKIWFLAEAICFSDRIFQGLSHIER